MQVGLNQIRTLFENKQRINLFRPQALKSGGFFFVISKCSKFVAEPVDQYK